MPNEPSDHTQLRPGQLVDWLVSRHDAVRAGPHRDVRLGTPATGLISWATKKELPKPGKQIVLHGQPTHAHEHLDFQGEHPKGYGQGHVAHEDRGQARILAVGPNKLHFALAHHDPQTQLRLVRPKGWDNRKWLTRNVTPIEEPKESKEAGAMSIGRQLGRLAAQQTKQAHTLTTAERRDIPKKKLGNPAKPATESGAYPMNDAAHARAAVGFAAMHHPNSELLARIRAKAHRLYPGTGSSK